MDGGGPKSCERTDGVVENVKDTDQGGGDTAGVLIFL